MAEGDFYGRSRAHPRWERLEQILGASQRICRNLLDLLEETETE
jgi:hypothetical protein